jgi:hypothetical protein
MKQRSCESVRTDPIDKAGQKYRFETCGLPLLLLGKRWLTRKSREIVATKFDQFDEEDDQRALNLSIRLLDGNPGGGANELQIKFSDDYFIGFLSSSVERDCTKVNIAKSVKKIFRLLGVIALLVVFALLPKPTDEEISAKMLGIQEVSSSEIHVISRTEQGICLVINNQSDFRRAIMSKKTFSEITKGRRELNGIQMDSPFMISDVDPRFSYLIAFKDSVDNGTLVFLISF